VSVDRETFTSIMSAFPTGVAVITTVDADGAPKGLTSNAVTSVSAEPPMLLVCIDRGSRTLPAMLAAGTFAVNFVRAGSDGLCRRFASRAGDKFAGIRWAPSPGGLPVLADDAVAWAECHTVQVVEAGDHVVFLGRVDAGMPPEPGDAPLVYFQREFGSYSAAMAQGQSAVKQ
jgi:flavin reductase (DIM6/NTAB) family NADH-FMN oxidoreductase RutF